MKKETNNKQKQDLGIYYTPEIVVDFIFDILNVLKDDEDKKKKRWQSRKPKPHYPSVIDPTCGEGIFLKKAIESGFTGKHPREKVPYIWGIDIDERVVKRWEEISLLKMFNGNRKKMKYHFYHQNGLIPLKEKKLRYKKKEDGLKQFDAVVGNPPYGGLGIYRDLKQLVETIGGSETIIKVETQELDTLFGEKVTQQHKTTENRHVEIKLPPNRLKELRDLSKSLLNYEVWKEKNYYAKRQVHVAKINGVDFNFEYLLTDREITRLKSYPIEILFVERFIQLTKPGGWTAVIIPDGILANSTNHYVREYISNHTKVFGIISLPRNTFAHTGTNAKTSILFLEKLKRKTTVFNYPVFMASVNELKEENLDIITQDFKKFIYRR